MSNSFWRAGNYAANQGRPMPNLNGLNPSQKGAVQTGYNKK